MSKQEELTNIGKKIGAIFTVIEPIVDLIEQEELDKFWDYLVKKDATLPLTDPTYYKNGGHAEIETALERVRILRILKEGKWRAE
jgi:hypothetical protein